MAAISMIQLINVTKQYESQSGSRSEIVAADRLNLEIPDGEIFGLVGPNGAGKTTTLKMVCGLQSPTMGQVLVNGVDVQRDPEKAQEQLGYLADFFSVYEDLKVWEYLDYFANAYKIDAAKIDERVKETIRRMNLNGKRDELISGLSRGMKQRLGIGRAVIHDPPLIILDEPAAGLDPKARVELKELLKELHAEGKTIFITSHILADLEEICTSIAVMEKGRLLRIGRIEDVMTEAAAVRRVRIRLAAAGFAAEDWLNERPGVSGISATATGAEFAFVGDDAALATLVRELVHAGAPVCGVEKLTETLERLYSRISTGEVM